MIAQSITIHFGESVFWTVVVAAAILAWGLHHLGKGD